LSVGGGVDSGEEIFRDIDTNMTLVAIVRRISAGDKRQIRLPEAN